jgi:hypothetical protein
MFEFVCVQYTSPAPTIQKIPIAGIFNNTQFEIGYMPYTDVA